MAKYAASAGVSMRTAGELPAPTVLLDEDMTSRDNGSTPSRAVIEYNSASGDAQVSRDSLRLNCSGSMSLS